MTDTPTVNDVVRRLAELSRMLDNATEEIARLDETAVRAKGRYQVTFAREFLGQEAGSVDHRKQTAVLACKDVWLDAEEAWPADWKNCDADCRHRGGNHCPYAGLRRNLAMVESGPVLCIAFINRASRGASHCAQAAEDAGIPTVRYEGGGS